MLPRSLFPMCLVACAGCATLTPFESPRTLEEGRWQVAVEARMMATSSEAGRDSTQLPTTSIAVRRGFRDGLELGARLGTRPELSAKWRLGAQGSERVNVAFVQALGGMRETSFVPGWVLVSRSALLVGLPMSSSEWILSPVLHATCGQSDGGLRACVFVPAASAGFRWNAGRWLALMPQVTLGYTLLHIGTGGPVVGGGFALEGGLAVALGGAEGL